MFYNQGGDHITRGSLIGVENQMHERFVVRIKKLEEQNGAQNSEIQNLIARIQELNTPPASPIMEASRGATKSRIVRPVAKKKEKSSTSLTSSIWSLFSPTKIFNQVGHLASPFFMYSVIYLIILL